jgi:hypothetical protein
VTVVARVGWYQMSKDQRTAILNRYHERDWPSLMRDMNRHPGVRSKSFDLSDPIESALFAWAVVARARLQLMDIEKRRTR